MLPLPLSLLLDTCLGVASCMQSSVLLLAYNCFLLASNCFPLTLLIPAILARIPTYQFSLLMLCRFGRYLLVVLVMYDIVALFHGASVLSEATRRTPRKAKGDDVVGGGKNAADEIRDKLYV